MLDHRHWVHLLALLVHPVFYDSALKAALRAAHPGVRPASKET